MRLSYESGFYDDGLDWIGLGGLVSTYLNEGLAFALLSCFIFFLWLFCGHSPIFSLVLSCLAVLCHVHVFVQVIIPLYEIWIVCCMYWMDEENGANFNYIPF